MARNIITDNSLHCLATSTRRISSITLANTGQLARAEVKH